MQEAQLRSTWGMEIIHGEVDLDWGELARWGICHASPRVTVCRLFSCAAPRLAQALLTGICPAPLAQLKSSPFFTPVTAQIHLIMRLVIIVTLSLVSTQAFKIDGGDGEKVCTLEKSVTNGENCFYEPECQNVCKDVQSTVSVIRL